MCGIFGYIDKGRSNIAPDALKKMGDALKHRGPDGNGFYHDQEKGIGLGNQRLAILDVENGQQPFFSDDNSIVVVQNGEIFNHVELAKELQQNGYIINTNCDTEVILRLYERDGIDGIKKLNGMFAIAIYDNNIDTLYLIRDRVGEKPLYFTNKNGLFVFASEIKAILQVVSNKTPNLDSVNQYLTLNYVPPPFTMFTDIYHVMPGTYLKISNGNQQEVTWFDLSDCEYIEQSESKWIEEFNSILDDSVRIRLRSDVPFGAFLSGGVDSSSVVGLMSKHLSQQVNTFCIGFNDPNYDESNYAEEASKRFNTCHIVEKVEPNMTGLWPMATYHCDQPHGDVSFLPTFKVSQLAAKKVKMVLTGDGADELFAGYDKYKLFFNESINNLSDIEFQNNYLTNISLFDTESRIKLFSKKLKEKINNIDIKDNINIYFEKAKNMDRINQALYIDSMLLLPGNNLVKPDRMGMAASIENRSPFLDYRMLSLGFSMPGHLKLNNGTTKYLYKKAVTPLIGKNLSYRKKQMFTVPIGEWFKTSLSNTCEDLLFSERTKNRELFDYKYVSSMYKAHKTGIENNTREIRALMALEIWFREFYE